MRANRLMTPEHQSALNAEYNRVINELDKIEMEQWQLAGETSVGRPLIAGGGVHIFRDVQNMRHVDKSILESDLNLDGREVN